jgi:hypothetical protein
MYINSPHSSNTLCFIPHFLIMCLISFRAYSCCSYSIRRMSLTLTLTSSNHYMSPLSMSACFPNDVSRHVRYSLPNPSESERPFSPLEELVLPALGRREGARNGTDCLLWAPGTPRHWPRRSQDPKAQYHWPWAVGAGVVDTVGGRDGDWEWNVGGWHIFYCSPVLTSITLAFFKSIYSPHSPCGIIRPTISRFWSFKKKKHIKDVFCL